VVRVRLIFPGALGDLLLLAPAAVALASGARDVEVSVQRALAEIAGALLPLGPPVDGAAMSTFFGVRLAPALDAWLRGADRVHAWLGGAGRVAIARHARALGLGAWQAGAVVRDDGPRHASAEYAAALGIDGPLAAVRLPVRRARREDSGDAWPWWTVPPRRRLLVHPGAGAVTKRWSVDGFRRVADAWHAAGGETVVLLGPAEADLAPFWRAAGHRVAADLGLAATARLIASAPRFLGNDSGISHLAGALDRRGVVLFGPTRPERWRPLGGRLAVVRFAVTGERALAGDVAARLGRP
jgi:hypothetical protein